MIDFSLEGLASLQALEKQLKTINNVLNTATRQCAEVWVTYIQVHMTSDGPSQPGAYPAVVSGNLRDSIQVDSATFDEFTILASAEYAGYLEEGTYKMLPRPFMWRAETAADLRPQFEEIIGSRLRIHFERS